MIAYIIIFFLFYLFAILQNSFLVHFNLFGVIPNLVFILFFILVFFEKPKNYYAICFYAITAGFFLDVFAYSYFGVSIVLLLFIGIASKQIQSTLQESKSDSFPMTYFSALFVASLLIYNILKEVFLDKFSIKAILISFNFSSITGLIYNLIIACIAFYIYKKFFNKSENTNQLRLFK